MSARSRGFIDGWVPRAETRTLLDVIKRVLIDYAEQLPLTVRQIFYILVGRYLYEKTERAYDRLGELLNRARRARLVDMDIIRDDGFTSRVPKYFDTIDDFLATIAHTARVLRFDRQRGQKRRLVLWCEVAGMVPQLARIADPYGIEVYSSGGFGSLTDNRIAKLWAGAPITFQHIGDHDASGVHCFSSLAEDIAAFTDAAAPSSLNVAPNHFQPCPQV